MNNFNAENGEKTIKTHEKIILKNWFQELLPAIQYRLQYSEPDPYNNVEYIYHLTPDEIREACADPKLRGMDLPVPIQQQEEWEEQLRNIIRRAAWFRNSFFNESYLDELSHYHFVRHYGGKPVIMHWNHRGDMVHQSIADFKNTHIDKYVMALNPKNGNWAQQPLTDLWLKSKRVKRFDYAEFHPGLRPEKTPDNILNLWRGWPLRDDIRHDTKDEPLYCRKFLDHIRYNLCGDDDEVFFYLIGWMADALNNPHRTSEVAIVLRGPQGSGKTLWAKCFMELFGKAHTLTLDKPDQVTGTHNKHLQDKCVVFADEAFFAGNRQHAATLKTLVTGDDIFVHPKFVDGFMAPKLFRLIIASNDEHVIRAEEDDRRYLVLDVDAGEHNQDGEYFGAIMDDWKGGGRQDLFGWLRGEYWRLVLEFGIWDVRERPKTKALQKQKDLSLPKTQAIVHQMLHDGELPELFQIDTEKNLVFVATRLVSERNRLAPKDETALGKCMHILAGPNTDSVRVYLDDGYKKRQYRGYWLPSLEDCRQRWESHLKRKIEWPKDPSSWGVIDSKSEGTPF